MRAAPRYRHSERSICRPSIAKKKSESEEHSPHMFPLYSSSLRVKPQNPILLCHGLLGVAGVRASSRADAEPFAGVLGSNYFRGVRERFAMLGVKEVARVPLCIFRN